MHASTWITSNKLLRIRSQTQTKHGMMSSIYYFRKGKIMGTRNRLVVARKWLGADFTRVSGRVDLTGVQRREKFLRW